MFRGRCHCLEREGPAISPKHVEKHGHPFMNDEESGCENLKSHSRLEEWSRSDSNRRPPGCKPWGLRHQNRQSSGVSATDRDNLKTEQSSETTE